MTDPPDERGRRAPTPAALASLGSVPDGYRILPDPLHGQPLLRLPAGSAQLRVRLDRSHESAQAGEPTQDYLAVRCDPRRLSFAVTDGVGSSFLGDVAAQILAAHLTDWLAPPRPAADLAAALTTFLHGLSRQVVDQVAAWPLADSVAGLVRAALDQQRSYGSEAMFAGGVVDLAGGRDATITVAWLGDARLRIVFRDGRQITHSGQTTDRWSSRLGPRGTVHTEVWPVAEVARVIACTDGLLPELEATMELADAALDVRLRALADRPGNDDLALIDVGLSPGALPGADAASAPTLWRRLTEEPPGRHAKPTPAGSALRRIMRAVAPGPASVSPPAPAPPSGSPVPRTEAPVPQSGSAVPPPGLAGPGRTVPAVPGRAPSHPAPGRATPTPPAGRAPSHSAPDGAASPVPPPRSPLEPAGVPAPRPTSHRAAEPAPPPSTVERTTPVGPPPPADVAWHRGERGPQLTWSPVAAADAYAVEVGREPTFAEALLYTVRGASFGLPPMPDPVFVRLRCVVNGEPGPWGEAHDLSTPSPGGQP